MGEEKDVEPNTKITEAAHFKVTMKLQADNKQS